MRLSKFVLVCGVVALMAAPALAQRQPGGGGGFGGAMSTSALLQNKSVQEELKLDKDQVTKIDDAVKKVRDDESLKDAFATLRDRQAKPEDRTAARKKVDEANTKALAGILKTDQDKRLGQIHYQVMGLAIFTDEEANKTLKITDDQKEKIKEVSDNLQKDMQALRPAPGGGKPDAATIAENQKKRQTLQKEAMASATKVLKADQKTALKDMTGEAFEIKIEFGGKPGGKPPAKPGNDF
jgi:hypothetical protein